MNRIDPSLLAISISTGVWAYVYFFVFCNLGETVGTGFDASYNLICQYEWYLFPANIQQILPIIMNAMQDEIHIDGFGNLSITRESFKRVNILLKYQRFVENRKGLHESNAHKFKFESVISQK